MKSDLAAATNKPTTEVADPSPDAVEDNLPTASVDPVVGEEPGHPIGVGAGALGAGAAGAAIGAVMGPLGIIVGAAIGALAGGVVGEQVAAAAGDHAGLPSSDLSGSRLVRPESPVASTMEPAGGSGLDSVGAGESELGESHLSQADAEDSGAGHSGDSFFADAETVRLEAYYRYIGRENAGIPGDAISDWLEAERSVTGVAT